MARKQRGRWLVMAALVWAPTAAWAQEAVPQGDAQPALEGVADVVVTGTRAALENAERVKRDANVIIDGISADDIAALPDASISDSLVRITGVTANDNPRGPNAVSIRGLGPDLTLTTVNGRILPSGSGGDRRIDLAQLPTEGISGAYIQKTPDAATIEGGVAGLLDLQTIHPLDTRRRGLTLVGRALFQDNSRSLAAARHYGKTGQRAEATYVGRLTDTLGVTATYAYLHQYSGFAGVQIDNWRLGTGPRADLNRDGVPDALPTNVGVTSNFNDDIRHSAIGMIQWDAADGIRASLDGMFVQDRLITGPTRFFANNIFNGTGLGAATSATVDGTNTAQAFSGPTALYREILNEQRALDRTYGGGFNLAVDHGLIKAVFDISIYRAKRRTTSPQATIENDAANATAQRQQFSYDIADPTDISLMFNPLTGDDYAVSILNDNLTVGRDTIKAARADFAYRPDDQSLLQSIAFGLRVDRREHSNTVDQSQWSWATLPARPDLDSSYLQLASNPFARLASLFGGAGAVNFPYYDLAKVIALKTAPGAVFSEQFTNDVAGTFSIREDTAALYAQLNVRSGGLSGNAGVRYVVTDGTVQGQSGTTRANVRPLTFNNTYRFLLPSANLRYELTPTLIGRLAYGKTFARQQWNDLAVSSAVDLTSVPTGVLTINRGNPNLKPFTANSFDISLEWNPDRATNIAVAGYLKYLKNFLVTSTESTTVPLADGTVVPAIIQTVVNDPGTSYLRGVEFNVRRDLTFLPGPFRNLGVQMNLNYNGTNIDQTVASLVGNIAPTSPDLFSKFVINGQLYYSTKRIDLRVAYRYFDPYIRAFFNSYQTQPDGQLDISGGITLYKSLRVIGSVTNLTKARMRRFVPDYRDTGNHGLTQLSVYQGRLATLGLRVTL